MPYRPSSTSQHKPPAIPNDCHYCKESGHWKNNCPSLLRKKQQWEGKSKYPAKWESQHKQPSHPSKPFHTTMVASPSTPFGSSETPLSHSALADFAEQFQRFVNTKPHAISASASPGLSSSVPSGSSFTEADWDRPWRGGIICFGGLTSS
ncbi:hypothetical protein ACHQM5_022704 [Ranunculus cassubicifolius]